jgi:hypothetical protein
MYPDISYLLQHGYTHIHTVYERQLARSRSAAEGITWVQKRESGLS